MGRSLWQAAGSLWGLGRLWRWAGTLWWLGGYGSGQGAYGSWGGYGNGWVNPQPDVKSPGDLGPGLHYGTLCGIGR